MVRPSVTERWAQPKTGNMILFDVGKGVTFEDMNYDVLEKIKNMVSFQLSPAFGNARPYHRLAIANITCEFV